ncbi:MAG: hypothetical protein WD991_00215 [Candidatus Paceibacterota bacterium]
MLGNFTFKFAPKPSATKEGLPPTEEGLTENLEAIWAKERKEGDPEIKVCFVFGYHYNNLDLTELKKEYADADVFIPESAGAGDIGEKLYQNVSAGIWSVDELEKKVPYLGDFTFALLRMIYNSKKSVVVADVPSRHSSVVEQEAIIELSKKQLAIKSLQEKVSLMKESIIRQVAANTERDNFIAQQIPRRLRKLIDGNSKIRTKASLKVLVFLGIIHTPVFAKMQRSKKPEVSRKFELDGSSFSVFQHTDELFRRIMAGQVADSISAELWEKAVFGSELGHYLLVYYRSEIKKISGKKLIDIVRKIPESFTRDDIRTVYNSVEKGENFMLAFLGVCKSKNIDVSGLFN